MAMQMLRPNAGQAQPQSFQQQPQQQQPQGEKPTTISPLTIHPDLTLDQNTKILTVGQGEASIFGQKYTLPALPFKLPATPALNSLQSLYPSESLRGLHAHKPSSASAGLCKVLAQGKEASACAESLGRAAYK